MAFLCVNTPHIDVFVKKEYLYDLQKGHGELVEGVWVTAKSIQGRALYFETYIPEYGAGIVLVMIFVLQKNKCYQVIKSNTCRLKRNGIMVGICLR